MKRYANRSGQSGVVAYEIGDDWIDVKFVGGTRYRYGPIKPGAIHVAALKRLAIAGQGLGTYISQHVRQDYESRDD